MNFSLNNLKFEDIKKQIIDYLKTNSEYYASFDFEGSNMNYIIDAMAYVTMQMSYQVSNVANNIFLDSTEIRKNAVSIAKTMGYRPRRIIPSRADVEITYTDTTVALDSSCSITIPAGTSFISDRGNYYLNETDIVLRYRPSKGDLVNSSVVLFQGIKKQFNQLSNGIPFQTVTIPSTKVSEIGFYLYIQDSITKSKNSILWSELANTFSLQNKNSYIVEEDLNNEGYVKISFGDGLIMNYPEPGRMIYIEYQEAKGSITNGEFLSTKPVSSSYVVSGSDAFIKSFADKNITIASNRTYGGQEIESIQSIRNNAPLSYANVGRLITENDYDSYLRSYNYLDKAKSIGGDTLFPGDQAKLGNIFITGLPTNYDDVNLKSLYLTSSRETELMYEINKFKILSTKINFYKPSYLYIDVTPLLEVEKHSTPDIITTVIENVTKALIAYINIYFKDFNPKFRYTNFLYPLENIAALISRDLNFDYYFLVEKGTFYDNERDIINLPIMIQSWDSNYNIASSLSFVRDNVSNKKYMGFIQYTDNDYDKDNFNSADYTTVYDKSNSSIYGKINNNVLNRYMYNVDNTFESSGNALDCNIKLHGINYIANLFNYENHSNDNVVTSLASGTLGITLVQNTNKTGKNKVSYINSYSISSSPEVSGYYDEYAILLTNNLTAGTIYRTASWENGYIGLVRKDTDIPLAGDTRLKDGVFMCGVDNIWIDGRNKLFGNPEGNLTFSEVRKNEWIYYNAASGDWRKTKYQGTISAVSGINFYNTFAISALSNNIYEIQTSTGSGGTFNGLLNFTLSAGEQMIYHFSPSATPKGEWRKVRDRSLSNRGYNTQVPFGGLDPTGDIPKIVTPFEIRIVSDTLETTTFGGRIDATKAVSAEDIIYYNSHAVTSEEHKWFKVCNWMTKTTDIPNKISAGADTNIYALGLSVSDIGTTNAYYIVTGDPGSFGNYTFMIDWPSDLPIEERIAVSGDILVYYGNDGSNSNKFKIYLQQYQNLYTLNGLNNSALPISADYGDKFTLNGSAGTFNGYFSETLTSGFIVYLDNNTWAKLVVKSYIHDATSDSISALPKTGTTGDYLLVNQDGNFQSNTISGLFAPSGEYFVQGDYIIFNGNYWTKMKEYSMSYNNDIESGWGRKQLNNLGLNSVFEYNFNYVKGQYEFIFRDIYDDVILGNMIYKSILNDYSKISKLIFNEFVSGKLDMVNTTLEPIKVSTLFSDNLDINKIRILPYIKSDKTIEHNFDTSFDNYLIINVKTPNVGKVLI